MFECITSENLNLDYAMVKFNAPTSSSITKNEPYAINEASMSDYCMFAQMVQSMPPVDDIKCGFNLGAKFGSDPFDGAHHKFVLYMDHSSWRHLMAKKDLHPSS